MAFSMDSMEAARAALALTEVAPPSIVTSTKGMPDLVVRQLALFDNKIFL